MRRQFNLQGSRLRRVGGLEVLLLPVPHQVTVNKLYISCAMTRLIIRATSASTATYDACIGQLHDCCSPACWSPCCFWWCCLRSPAGSLCCVSLPCFGVPTATEPLFVGSSIRYAQTAEDRHRGRAALNLNGVVKLHHVCGKRS